MCVCTDLGVAEGALQAGVRQCTAGAGLVATVGKLLLRPSLPLQLGAHEEDEDGRRKPLWVPLGLPEKMLGWMA